jgi:hypothetical protein
MWLGFIDWPSLFGLGFGVFDKPTSGIEKFLEMVFVIEV